MLLNDEATLTASVAGPVERNIFSFLSFPLNIMLFFSSSWGFDVCVCVYCCLCYVSIHSEGGASTHTDRHLMIYRLCANVLIIGAMVSGLGAGRGRDRHGRESNTTSKKASIISPLVYYLSLPPPCSSSSS